MRVLRLVALIMIVAMVSSVTVAWMTSPFTADGQQLLELAWGRVTIIDLYLALAAFTVFVGWRDGSAKAVLWAAIVAVTGSAGIGAYLLIATRNATTVADVLLGSRRS